jgi:hypothetical protein
MISHLTFNNNVVDLTTLWSWCVNVIKVTR